MKQNLSIVIAVAAVALVCVFYIAYRSGGGAQQQVSASVVIHHTASGKTHKYAGTIEVSSCDSLGTMVTTQGSSLTIDLQTTASGTCPSGAEVEQPFTVSFTPAGGTPQFNGVMLNGKPLAYEVVEGAGDPTDTSSAAAAAGQ